MSEAGGRGADLREVRAVAVVTNPSAGQGRARHAAREIMEQLSRDGVEIIEIHAPSAAGTREQLRAVLAAGPPDAVVCVGGDGLVSTILDPLAHTTVPLALLPAGTGNDLARELGIGDDPRAAADLVRRGSVRTIDLGRLESSGHEPMWFATVACTGYDARVTLRANRMRRPRGRLRYTFAAVAEIAHGTSVPYRIELGGVHTESVVETEALLVAVGNTTTYGGGMRICPGAVCDDGLLDVTIVGKVSHLEMLRILPALSAGKRIEHPAVRQYRVESVRLSAPDAPATADGEPAGHLPVTLRIAPRALTVLC
ncbi:diacylglycerol/lipid kinase family protein [Nocardia flavorosea]|uniref:YegS/Rv2252/BmrU family lipid kinase n=1 Tax=Nocardia flavorosea TaxID=53429 RepID=A0A846YQ80_9NOCA|nr:YegS/Rv2252/BmrU family lipid kinase [Nocardia flavorosea]NKY59871.1 YegS/Rv2252/BmrU family lipid kinase [Nocardia flavorosea]